MSEKYLVSEGVKYSPNVKIRLDRIDSGVKYKNPIKKLYNRAKAIFHKTQPVEELDDNVNRVLEEINEIERVEDWAKKNYKILENEGFDMESAYHILWEFKKRGVEDKEFIRDVVRNNKQIFRNYARKPMWYIEDVWKIMNYIKISKALENRGLPKYGLDALSDKEMEMYNRDDEKLKKFIEGG